MPSYGAVSQAVFWLRMYKASNRRTYNQRGGPTGPFLHILLG